MQSPSFLTVLYTHSLGVSHKSRENSDFRYHVSWPKLIPGRSILNLSLTFRGSCIVLAAASVTKLADANRTSMTNTYYVYTVLRYS